MSELQQELNEACGISVHETTIVRALRRRGFSRKKVTLIAITFKFRLLTKLGLPHCTRAQ